MTQVYTFTVQATSDATQAKIDEGDGQLVITLPWDATRGFEDVQPGDGAVIEVADHDDKTCWIGDVDDVEFEAGYPMTVLIDVR